MVVVGGLRATSVLRQAMAGGVAVFNVALEYLQRLRVL
jgi:hypothetical protein